MSEELYTYQKDQAEFLVKLKGIKGEAKISDVKHIMQICKEFICGKQWKEPTYLYTTIKAQDVNERSYVTHRPGYVHRDNKFTVVTSEDMLGKRKFYDVDIIVKTTENRDDANDFYERSTGEQPVRVVAVIFPLVKLRTEPVESNNLPKPVEKLSDPLFTKLPNPPNPPPFTNPALYAKLFNAKKRTQDDVDDIEEVGSKRAAPLFD